jgi:hypothetical protein
MMADMQLLSEALEGNPEVSVRDREELWCSTGMDLLSLATYLVR